MSFGNGIHARSTKLLARGQTVDGRVVSVHQMEYSAPIPGMGTTGVAVDIGGSQGAGDTSIGFASVDDARDYLTTLDAQAYTVFDGMGNAVQETRTGLGIPDGMIRWVDNANASPRPAPVAVAVVPPNAAQYPEQAAALNSPPDAADKPQGHLSGADQQTNATVDTRTGADATATRTNAGDGDPKHDGDGQGAGPGKDAKNHDSTGGKKNS